jgi:hypothetical protein
MCGHAFLQSKTELARLVLPYKPANERKYRMSDEQIALTGTSEPQEAHSDITVKKGASTEREREATIQL